ncbi:MAG: metal ABC transporter substrate-binding protein [Candidatus Entotheonellia bacterium]
MSLVVASPGLIGGTALAQGDAQPLRVAATVPDLGSLVREIGGDEVAVTVFAKGTEDPHFVEAKPSFIKTLSGADLFVEMGMELELGWAPVLQQNARNGNVLPGGRGFLDASTVITPLEVPSGPVDRSLGDVHPAGNPHYLLDPINGLRVARLIRDKLIELRPERQKSFDGRYADFRQRLGAALVGDALAKRYDVEKLALLFEAGKVGEFLKSQGEESLLGGWFGLMMPYRGAKVVVDHNMWPYFARRFGISVIGFLEPKPGLPPTTKHLNELIESMRAQGVKVILANPYFDPRFAQFVAERTGAQVVSIAHMVGARAGTNDYISMIDYDVRQLAGALRGRA